MSDLTLKMILIAQDKASQAIKKIGDESDDTSKRVQAMSKVAAVGLLGLATGVAAIFKTGIDEQSDFLKGQAQLEAGLKSTGNAANTSVDHLEDLASSIQNYSGQTDDSIVASEQLLLTFTNIQNQAGKNNDIFDQTVKISADMAAKMGGDASSSAIQLGKALNDPVKGISALTRVGVSFTEQQKDQIAELQKNGDIMGAQKVIIAELNKEFGGSAKAAGDTLPGQLARARRSFEDVSQSVVAALMPVLLKLTDVLTKYIVPALKAVVGFVIQNKNWLGPLAVAVLAIVVALKLWAVIQAVVNAELWANPVGLVIAAIALLAAGIYLLIRNWQAVVDFLHGPWGTAISAAIAVFMPFIGIPMLIVGHWAEIRDFFTGLWSWLKDTTTDVTQWVVDKWNAVINFFTGLPGRMAGLFAGMWDGIKESFRAALNWVIGKWNGLQFTTPNVPGTNFGGVTIGVPDIPYLALGGDIMRAGAAVVGDNGPEVLSLPVGARVTPLNGPNKDGFGGTSDITVQVLLDGRIIGQSLERISNTGTPLNIKVVTR